MLHLIGSIALLACGSYLWATSYLKMRKKPAHDRLRGLACLPGVVLTVAGLVMLAFYFHWLIGFAAIVAVCWIAVKVIL